MGRWPSFLVRGDENEASLGSGSCDMGQDKTWFLQRDGEWSVCRVLMCLCQMTSEGTGAT